MTFSGNQKDTVAGMVFQITSEELRQSDDYEVAAYIRVEAVLQSGEMAWVYQAA